VKIKGVAHYGDGRGDVSVTSTATMTLNAWHLVIWGYDQAEAADFTTTNLTGRVMFVQVDNGARDKVALAYFPIVGPFNDLILGQRKGGGSGYTLPFSGRVDQLTFAGRNWDTVVATEFYNAGSGKAYPFVASSFDSLNDGLFAYWNMDEAVASGPRADLVGQADLSDYTTGIGYTAGKVGNGAVTNAAQEVLQSFESSLSVGSDSFSVGGWVKPTGAGSAAYFASKISGSYGEWSFYWNGSNTLRFWVADSTGVVSGPPAASCSVSGTTTISNGTWYFLVGRFDASTKTCTVYVNNVQVGASDTSTTFAATQSAAVVVGGATNGSTLILGTYDEWFFYKRLLTTVDMTNLYNSGNGRTYPF